MTDWIQLDSADAIDAFLDACRGFHDACFREARVTGETHVDDRGNMHCPGHLETSVTMVFESQWAKPPRFEVWCTGVSLLRLSPTPDNCDSILAIGVVAPFGGSWRLGVNYFGGALSGPPDSVQVIHAADPGEAADIEVIAQSMAWRRLGEIGETVPPSTSEAATRGPARMSADVTRGDYTISTERHRLDVAAIHRFLSQSYWSPGIPAAIVERAIANSICFGLFHDHEQVGFARVATDRATFAYLADVYVLEAHRGKGLSKWLMEVITRHEDLQGLRRFLLATRDAHDLYRQFGFVPLANPAVMMEIVRPDVYRSA
jgi:GNAT superfamily N-acetyltransferase